VSYGDEGTKETVFERNPGMRDNHFLVDSFSRLNRLQGTDGSNAAHEIANL